MARVRGTAGQHKAAKWQGRCSQVSAFVPRPSRKTEDDSAPRPHPCPVSHAHAIQVTPATVDHRPCFTQHQC